MPLIDFVRALPADLPIGIEVPMKSLSDNGVSPLERARLALKAARETLESARRPTLEPR
jgi:hypothetical protein